MQILTLIEREKINLIFYGNNLYSKSFLFKVQYQIPQGIAMIYELYKFIKIKTLKYLEFILIEMKSLSNLNFG